MAIIREATLQDLEDIILMLHNASVELPEYNVLGFSVQKVAQTISALIQGEHGVVNLVEADGKPIGIIAGALIDYWFNDDYYATDIVVFVEKDYRKSNYGYRLIKSFVKWAEEQGVAEITTGVSSGVDIEKAGRLFEGLGFKYRGKIYSMRGKE